MFPIKDDIATRRPVVTLTAIVAAVVVYVAAGPDGWALLPLAATLWMLWLFGPTVEDAMGPALFVVFGVLAGGATLGVQVLADADATLLTVAASGTVGAVIAAYAVLYPRAHVLALMLVPFAFTILALPALAVAALWLPLQLACAAADVAAPVGAGAYLAAQLAGVVFGALGTRLFARRVREDYESPRRIPVYR